VDYQDILYEERAGSARIAINRPDVMNAFRGQTVEELLHALQRAGWNKQIAAIVLTGTGDRAFCTGGDQSSHSGQYDGRGTVGLPVEELHGTRSASPTSAAMSERSRSSMPARWR
jgi:2-ketocyclohexanecarboxyl-CoA hydrolase